MNTYCRDCGKEERHCVCGSPFNHEPKPLMANPKQPTEAQIKKYILAVKHMPLVEGQLASMVILRFDIPDERAKQLVAETLGNLEGEK